MDHVSSVSVSYQFFSLRACFLSCFNCYADFWTSIMLLCLIPLLYLDLKAINIFKAV